MLSGYWNIDELTETLKLSFYATIKQFWMFIKSQNLFSVKPEIEISPAEMVTLREGDSLSLHCNELAGSPAPSLRSVITRQGI